MTIKFFAVATVGAVFASGLAAASLASANSWTMPNLIGMDLQGAQLLRVLGAQFAHRDYVAFPDFSINR